jgi:hypothetical protein
MLFVAVMDTADPLLVKEVIDGVARADNPRELLEITTFGRTSGRAAKAGDRFWGLITGSPSRTIRTRMQ